CGSAAPSSDRRAGDEGHNVSAWPAAWRGYSVPRPASLTLTSYRGRAVYGSWASREGGFTRRSAKYCPVKVDTLGDATRNTGVSAPCAGLLKNMWTNRNSSDVWPPRFVLMTPGWQALTVTPVPARRRANSAVKRTCASFDWPYARGPRYFVSPWRSSKWIEAPLCAVDATFTIREGAEAINRSRSRWERRKPLR